MQYQMRRLRVKEVAKEKGYTMAKLSRMADLNYRTVQAIYRDPTHDVTFKTLDKIASVLGVSIMDLIEDVPDQPPTQ